MLDWKRFLLSAQGSFYIVLSSYVEEHVKKIKPKFHAFGFQTSKIWKQVLKSFASRNNSLEPLAVGFSYGLEECTELRALISSILR